MKKGFLIVFLALISCNSGSLNLKLLDKDQQQILTEILRKNDSILNQDENLDINDLYFNHLRALNKKNDIAELSKSLFVKNKSHLITMSNLNLLSVSKIRSFRQENEDYEFDINLDGNYFKYIQNCANESKPILKYVNSLKSTGGISPVLTKQLLFSYTREDLKNENLRLIICIHFLLINQAQTEIQR